MNPFRITLVFLIVSIYSFSQDSTKKATLPVSKENVGKPLILNGYYVLYNKEHQKTKDGVFKENRLFDGKNYIYNEKGTLVRIEIYKEGNYTGDATIPKD